MDGDNGNTQFGESFGERLILFPTITVKVMGKVVIFVISVIMIIFAGNWRNVKYETIKEASSAEAREEKAEFVMSQVVQRSR